MCESDRVEIQKVVNLYRSAPQPAKLLAYSSYVGQYMSMQMFYEIQQTQPHYKSLRHYKTAIRFVKSIKG